VPAESAKSRDIGRVSQTRERELALAKLAKRQHGVVGRRQLEALGLGEDAIRHRLQLGRLNRLHSGAFSVGLQVVPIKGWWMAAVLACGEEAVLSHHAAAALWGLRNAREGAVDVTLPRKSRSCRYTRRHYSFLPADERTVKDGIPVTTVPRTILDLAATEPADTVENLLRESEYLQLTDRLSLPDLLERYPGKRGTRKVHLALERLEEEPHGRRRSPLEERFAPFLRLCSLPMPRFNDWIVLGGKRYCVDCHWPGTNQIVELDGWQAHGTRSAFREDKARDRRLAAAGYTVTHITWNQLEDEPDEIASDLRVLLRDR
jgi:very-short-patch-repair endonuclease/predicted transcriptional regulator of viral defense system